MVAQGHVSPKARQRAGNGLLHRGANGVFGSTGTANGKRLAAPTGSATENQAEGTANNALGAPGRKNPLPLTATDINLPSAALKNNSLPSARRTIPWNSKVETLRSLRLCERFGSLPLPTIRANCTAPISRKGAKIAKVSQRVFLDVSPRPASSQNAEAKPINALLSSPPAIPDVTFFSMASMLSRPKMG